MQFQPKSSAEIEKERAVQGVWPIGEYPFEVLAQAKAGDSEIFTEERQSQSGNDMIQLVVSVMHPLGVKRVVRDYLLANNPVKLYEASVACGAVAEYGAGKLTAASFIGKRGVLRLGIEKGKGEYKDKNNVQGYISGSPDVAPSHAVNGAAPIPTDALADQIPF